MVLVGKVFLKNRSQKEVINGKRSYSEKVTSGIPQGSVLCLILLPDILNDLPEVINACVKLFADDAKLFGRVNSNTSDQPRQCHRLGTDMVHELPLIYILETTIHFEYTMQTNSGEVKVQKVAAEKYL